MKKVWILNHYAGMMFFNHGGRHYNFAKFLPLYGYESVIFCCNAKHSSNSEEFFEDNNLWSIHIAEDINTPFIYVKARTYSGNGKKRIFNMIDFYRNVQLAAKEYGIKYGKPDVILASSVHPLTLIAGEKIAKRFGIKCICEMRDLWPEALIAYSIKLQNKRFISNILYTMEKNIYKKAHALIFTQEGGIDYIRKHKWDFDNGGPIDLNKVYHINNGVDLDAFLENREKFYIEDKDLDNPNIYKVVYTGAIRRINNLGIIVDTAKVIEDKSIKFLIWGNGDELEYLKKRVEDEKIENIVFKGRVNKQYIPSIVSRADLNLVHWEMNPLVSNIGESYNKAFEYFAAGKPVFYTIRPGYSIVEKYHCGYITDGFTPIEIAQGIEKIKNITKEEKLAISQNAKLAAHDYDFKILTKELVRIMESL